jgi:hypothetical protein
MLLDNSLMTSLMVSRKATTRQFFPLLSNSWMIKFLVLLLMLVLPLQTFSNMQLPKLSTLLLKLFLKKFTA